MKLSEKIRALRKENRYTQEELAELCNVSRQAITKWEADIALPETDKLILLSRIFRVTVDVLLKDELSVQGTKEVHSCGKNVLGQSKSVVYEGLIIKESIEDERIIDLLEIHKVELWKTGGKPCYWTAMSFTSHHQDLPERLSKAMIAKDEDNENWFVDFKSGAVKYIVFRNEILKYAIGDQEGKSKVCDRCLELGIPKEQMQWSE